MSLFACPNEILEHIVWRVSSDDIENFSISCRLLRRLAEPRLRQHFKLKSRWGYNVNYPLSKSLHPAEILSAIVVNPEISCYIKALSLTFNSGRYAPIEGAETLISRHDGFRDQLNGRSHPQLRQTGKRCRHTNDHDPEVPWIPCHEVEKWHGRILRGDVDSLFALLLCYLHNLRELRVQRPILIPMTSVIIGRLRASIVESISCETGSFADLLLQQPSWFDESPFPSPPGLSRLERVIIDPAVSLNDTHPRHRLGDFARFASFGSLPSLKHLNGISLVSRKYNIDHSFTGFSGLRSVRLINCNIASAALRSLLAGITALESFHYTPTVNASNREFSLTPVVEDLKRFASHSLGRLYLRHNYIETRSETWKYRAFELLKKIDLDWRCLVHYEAPSRPTSSGGPSAASNVQSVTAITTAPPSVLPSTTSTSTNGPPSLITGVSLPKFHHPPLVDTLPRSTESLKIVDIDGEAKLETVRWIFFKLVMQRTARLPNLKIVIFVTPRRDCWSHAKEICTRAGLKYPTYGVDRERHLRDLNFVYE